MSDKEFQVIEKMKQYLDQIFPENEPPIYWGQGSYRSDLFNIFTSAYQSSHMQGDPVFQLLKDQWRPNIERSKEETCSLQLMCQAWNEWVYAWDNHPRINK